MTGDGASLQLEAHQPFGGTGRCGLLQGLATDELRRHLQMHQPAQAGFKRCGVRVHVHAVEVHGGFQPQGVACPEPAGADAAIQQDLPELLPVVRTEQQLSTVLTGVSRAGCEHRMGDSLEVEAAVAEAGQAAEVLTAQLLQQSHGVRALESEQHAAVLDVGHREASRIHALTDPGGVCIGAGGVDHQHQGTLVVVEGAAVVNDQVIPNAAGLVQQHRVTGFAGSDAMQIARHQLLQCIFGVRPLQPQNPHMGDVEHAHVFADGFVLMDQPTELHRHLPTCEGHHAAAAVLAELMERRALQGHGRLEVRSILMESAGKWKGNSRSASGTGPFF